MFFLLPHTGYSYADKSTNTATESCCEKATHQHESGTDPCCTDKDQTDSDCMNNCAKACKSNTQSISDNSINEKQFSFLNFMEKKAFPPFTQSHYSSGFHFIWQPPKIG